jgi:hypothetical protein
MRRPAKRRNLKRASQRLPNAPPKARVCGRKRGGFWQNALFATKIGGNTVGKAAT